MFIISTALSSPSIKRWLPVTSLMSILTGAPTFVLSKGLGECLKHFTLTMKLWAGSLIHGRDHIETTQLYPWEWASFSGHSSIVFPSFSLMFLHVESTKWTITLYKVPLTTCFLAFKMECRTIRSGLRRFEFIISIAWSSPPINSLLPVTSLMSISTPCPPIPASFSACNNNFNLIMKLWAGSLIHGRDHIEIS